MMQYIADVRSYNDEQIASVDDITLEEHLMGYTKNEVVHRFMGQVAGVYCVVPAWQMSAGEFIRCFNRESAAHASGYPQGGCIAITNAYLGQFRKFGGELKLNTPVEKIIVENNKAAGVVAGGEEYRADMIVSNAGLKETILGIMGGEGFDEPFLERIRNLTYSQGTSVARIALDKPLTDIMMYSNSNGLNPRENEAILRSGKLPESCTTMLVAPSNFSTSVAPEGMQYVCAGSANPIGGSDEVAQKLCDRIVDTAAEYVPGLKEHTIFVDKTTPAQFAKMFGKDGSVIGLAQVPGQVGAKRPPIKSPLNGLYFVGAETGTKGDRKF